MKRTVATAAFTAVVTGVAVLVPLASPAAALSQVCHDYNQSVETLQQAVDTYICVDVPQGVYMLSSTLAIPGGHTLMGDGGAGKGVVILRAVKAPLTPWSGTQGLVKTKAPYDQPVHLEGLDIDGGSYADHAWQGNDAQDGAWIGVNAPGMIINYVTVLNARCIGISTYEDRLLEGTPLARTLTTVVTGTHIINNGFECSTAAKPPGGAVYIHPANATDVPARILFQGDFIYNNDGSAFDIDNVDNGSLIENEIYDNSVVDGWAAISIGDGSNWTIAGNDINEPARRGKLNCPGGPAGPNSSAIFLCARLKNITGNVISGNTIGGYYGILINGVNGVASGNTIRDNYLNVPLINPISGVRCAEHFTNANTWSGNNCQTGLAPGLDEPPTPF